MKQIEVKSKTVHEAIEEACEKLGVSQDQVSIEILSQGGMFGKAKVLVTVKEEARKAPVVEPVKTSPVVEPVKTSPVTAVAVPPPYIKGELPSKESSKENPVKQKPLTKSPLKQGGGTAPAVTGDVKKPAPVATGPSDPNCAKFQKTLAFVTTFLELLGNDSTVTTELTDKSYDININGENIGMLIGKNGSTLNSIQAIVTSIAISNSQGEGKRVLVNVGDYKERRGDTLQAIAMKKSDYVKRTGRFVKLDPMNARDRAIVHTTLQDVEGIKTYSTGRDPFRCLCIAPADANDKNSKLTPRKWQVCTRTLQSQNDTLKNTRAKSNAFKISAMATYCRTL
jgi:spoIIIJ-associated protein